MAKVEQFPGQTGENIKTEDIEKQKTKEMSAAERFRRICRSPNAG